MFWPILFAVITFWVLFFLVRRGQDRLGGGDWGIIIMLTVLMGFIGVAATFGLQIPFREHISETGELHVMSNNDYVYINMDNDKYFFIAEFEDGIVPVGTDDYGFELIIDQEIVEPYIIRYKKVPVNSFALFTSTDYEVHISPEMLHVVNEVVIKGGN